MVSSKSLAPLYWGLLAGWAAGIWVLSSLPAQEIEPFALPFPYFDKLQHAIAFAIGGVLQWLALRHSTQWSPARIATVSILAIATFGTLDEFHQTFVATRSGADFFDWVADVLGAVLGTFGIAAVHPKPPVPALRGSQN